MSEQRLEALEENLKSVTDNYGKLMDLVLQKGFKPAFRCTHSGLLLPGDYVKEWGRKYGIGLGPQPVSEVLDSDYDTAPPSLTNDVESIEQIMHPVGPSFAQVDFLMVAPSELTTDHLAVLDLEDRKMRKRSNIIMKRQLQNPRSRLRGLHAAFTSQFNTTGRGI